MRFGSGRRDSPDRTTPNAVDLARASRDDGFSLPQLKTARSTCKRTITPDGRDARSSNVM